MERVGLVLVDDFQIINFGALAAFEVANIKIGVQQYEILVLSEAGGSVRNAFGMEVQTSPLDLANLDTVLVGASSHATPITAAFRQYLQNASRSSKRVASICVGAFALGEAGLLDHRNATTHWAFASELQQRFPAAKVAMDRIFVRDDNIWTSAGMSAGIDLALGMIERDLGRDVARAVAKALVLYHRRAGGQSQHSALLELDAMSDRVQTALTFARAHLDEPLPVRRLAEAAFLSERQFTRLFREETGQTPAKAIEALRLEAARFMMEQGRLPVETVARESGFGDRERMRRAFVRAFGQSPQAVRNEAGPLSVI